MLLWLDLETTGLAPRTDRVLEVAAIATDDRLCEIARFHRVTAEAQNIDLRSVDRFVQEMHARTGLWSESLLASERLGSLKNEAGIESSSHIACVDADLALFIVENCSTGDGRVLPVAGGAKNGPQLAGSTISFDRAFLAQHLPTTHAHLHYRNLDVSSLNEFARRFVPTAYESRPKQDASVAHRAMVDVEASLTTAKHYAAKLGPVPYGE